MKGIKELNKMKSFSKTISLNQKFTKPIKATTMMKMNRMK